MTLRELSRYSKLQERLEQNRAMLSALYTVAGLGAQVMTGMPYTPGVSDSVGDLVMEITDLQERIASLESECACEKAKLELYINAIPDDQVRIIFRLRFLHCMTWQQVAKSIGGGNTEKGVQSICYRYLKSCRDVRSGEGC